MKTVDEMINHAIMVSREPEAIVGVFFGTYAMCRKMFNHTKDYTKSVSEDFTSNRQNMVFIHKDGGKILFRAINTENLSDHSGSQYTHTFIMEDVDYAGAVYAESRVRTTKKFTAPIGAYYRYGAKVMIDY